MKINWKRIKESLYHLDPASGASEDYARGCIVTVASCLTALGMDWKTIWSHLVRNIPDGFRTSVIPTVWLSNLEEEWKLPLDELVTFQSLISEIPEDMQKIAVDEYGWTCRDRLLDQYLYVLAIMQRETEGTWARYKEDMWKASEPMLHYHFDGWRHAGSQFIAEWSVSDMRKERSEKINWHGQNTSQWLYAGALCVQDGMVSIHT